MDITKEGDKILFSLIFGTFVRGFTFNSKQYIFVNVNDVTKIGTTEGDDPSSARGGLPACRLLIIDY